MAPLFSLRCVVVVFSLAALACGGVPALEVERRSQALMNKPTLADEPLPVVTFDADWRTSTSAPLRAGRAAILRYHADRLGSCRSADWYVSVSFKGEHGRQHDAHYRADAATEVIDLYITVPYGPEVELWFSANAAGGAAPCQAWDSQYGANYRLPVQNPPAAIHFRYDWSVQVSGALKAGQPVEIDFDLWRFEYPYCIARAQHDRYTGQAEVYLRANGGPIASGGLLNNPAEVPELIDGQPGRMQLAPTATLPTGARTLEVWFKATRPDDPGCVAWESAFGANYTFAVAP